MAATATGIILVAGTVTFANEWYQTRKVNWRIPLATIIGGAVFDGFAQISPGAATGLAVMVLIGALTTEFNHKSVANTVTDVFSKPARPKPHDQVV